jgi:penicillin amidase
VNYFLATQPLSPEYGLLETTQVDPWTPLDSVAIGKLRAFGLSFDLDIGNTQALLSYQFAGGAFGFDGTALFFEDLYRTQPFDPAATVPDAQAAAVASASHRAQARRRPPGNRASSSTRQSRSSPRITSSGSRAFPSSRMR